MHRYRSCLQKHNTTTRIHKNVLVWLPEVANKLFSWFIEPGCYLLIPRLYL